MILGTGPSLTQEDVDACRRFHTYTIAISDAYRLAPWTSVLYAPDARWWDWHQDALSLPCLRYSLQSSPYQGVTRLAPGIQRGLETDPRFLATGGHGGWQAINLAVHLGAARIILLGYDMQPSAEGVHHFFGEHPNHSHVRYEKWLSLYESLCTWLVPLGVTIVNASRATAISGVPRVDLVTALCPHSPSATLSPAK